MVKLSICIPTYNRATLLKNCLQSIISIKSASTTNFQVCISDNCSTDNTEDIVHWAQQQIPIKYQKNDKNLGMSQNFVNVVQMSEGEFIWMIGDDDLVMPLAIKVLFNLFFKHPSVDFIYVNSYHLTTEYVLSYPQPFDLKNLPKKMNTFSSFKKDGEIAFLDLVNPKISFDFLGGIFLCVFKRRNWILNVEFLDKEALKDLKTFSHFDNTFPHLKIFSKAFSKSLAYFHKQPISICLTGAREWGEYSRLMRSIRFVEALELYRRNGLKFYKYIYYRNHALKNFIPDMLAMMVNKVPGKEYINPKRLLLKNCIYPNFYGSIVYLFLRKLKKILFK